MFNEDQFIGGRIGSGFLFALFLLGCPAEPVRLKTEDSPPISSQDAGFSKRDAGPVSTNDAGIAHFDAGEGVLIDAGIAHFDAGMTLFSESGVMPLVDAGQRTTVDAGMPSAMDAGLLFPIDAGGWTFIDAGGGVQRDAGVLENIDAGFSSPENPTDLSGTVLGSQWIGDYTVDELRPWLAPNVQIDNGYSVWRIHYRTDGREAWATLTIPFDASIPASGWHVAINNPGTVGLDDPCVLGGTVFGTGLSGTFGGRGLIGVQVDYPGLGSPGLHPYLVRKVEGRASLDAARATLAFAEEQGIPLTGRVAIAGLSQGGHATIAAAMEHAEYASELDVAAFAACAPASGFLEQWTQYVDVPGSHVVYHAMVAYAWSDYYGYLGPSIWDDSKISTIDQTMQGYCLVNNWGEALVDRLGLEPSWIFSDDFLTAFAEGDFAAYPFMDEGFSHNRLVPYAQTAPLIIYQGDADYVVPKIYTDALVQALQAGGVSVEYEVVLGGTHLDVAFGFLAENQRRTEASIAWIKEKLEGN